MPKFHFRLATLLRLNESVRDERRSKLAEAFRADELLEQREAMVADEIAATRAGGRKAVTPGAVDLDRIVEAQRYEMALRARQKLLEQQRKAVGGEIERRREAVLAANREVRALEKLRERHKQRYQQDETRREVRELDEVALRTTCRGDE